jgi:hypothetical protein
MDSEPKFKPGDHVQFNMRYFPAKQDEPAIVRSIYYKSDPPMCSVELPGGILGFRVTCFTHRLRPRTDWGDWEC